MDIEVIEKELKEDIEKDDGTRKRTPYSLHMPDLAVAEFLGYKITDLNDIEVFRKVKEYLRDELGLGSNINHRLSLRTMGVALGSKLEVPEDGIDFITERVLEDYEDFEKIENFDPWDNEVITPFLEKGKEIREKMPEFTLSTGVVCPLSTAVAIRPIEKILKDTRKNKEDLHRLLKLAVDYNLSFVKAFTEEFGGATASISAPLMSTDILNHKQQEEFTLPYLEEMIDGIYQITGYKPSLHICGHSKDIWDDLKKFNIASFSVDNCEDLSELKEAMGDSIYIVGNVPPVEIIRFGSIEDVVENVKECIEKAGDSPSGYTVATGCQVPPGTKEENLKAFAWAARKFG